MKVWTAVREARLRHRSTRLVTFGRWWELELECGCEIERPARYVPRPGALLGFAAQRAGRPHKDLLPAPRKALHECKRGKP